MDAILRIQVKVAAREARDALNGVVLGVRSVQRAMKDAGGGSSAASGMTASFKSTNAELNKINRNLTTLKGSSSMSSMDSDAAKVARRIKEINVALRSMRGATVATPSMATPGVSSRWSPTVAAKQDAKRIAAIRATSLAEEKRHTAALASAWKQQTNAARSAAAERKSVEKQQAAALSSAWKQQTAAAKSAAGARQQVDKASVAAAKVASTAAKEVQKQQAAFMKQVWKQQVVDAKVAATAAKEVQKQQASYMKQVWRQQVADAKTAAAALKATQRQELADLKAAAAAELREKRAVIAEEKMIAKERLAASKAAGEKLNFFQRMSLAINGQTSSSRKGMMAFGKDLQWVGRQLNFNFTIPLVAAATAATKWALANEKAWVRVKKVYGDGASDYTGELDQVRNAMRLLSDIYGVQQDQVIELAGRWAAAGATGAELAKSVESSLKLSILGDYEDLGAAFEDLITIQGAFQLSTGQTATVIAELNTVENMTAATMQDLARGVALAGGAAHAAGVTIEELAGHMALLVPVTGSASNAGNALKTIYSELMYPTTELIDILDQIGVGFYSSSFQALSGAGRLQLIADKYAGMTDAQKSWLGGVVAGRRQLNRFITLVEGLADKTSKFHEVMTELDPGNAAGNWDRANKEIQTLLESDPKKLEIIVTQMKNMLAEAVIPLIPALTYAVSVVKQFFTWVGNLDPRIQKVALVILALVVAAGVLSQAFGSAVLLVGTFGKFIAFLGGHLFSLVGILKTVGMTIIGTIGLPWTIAIGIALAVLFLFRDQLAGIFGSIWGFIKKGFNLLPDSVQKAMSKVIDVVARAVRFVRELLTKINPFADDEVGGATGKFGELGGTPKTVSTNTKFGGGSLGGGKAGKFGDLGNADADAAADVTAAVSALQAQMDAMQPTIDAHEASVKAAEAAYDAASKKADLFDSSLDPLRDEIDRLSDAIANAKELLGDFADTPIQGMMAMSDAIFENEMAQKRLRLELLRMADAGEGFEDVQVRISALNGDIEMLQGKIGDLRQNGAGSDVLGVYEDELKSLETQRDGLRVSGDVAQGLQDQLDALAHAGEQLDLEKSLQFDDMLRQIDKLATGVKEMSFDEIVAGIQAQQAAIETLTPAYDAANLELEAQEIILKSLNDERDRLKGIYDDERAALELLTDAYSALSDQQGDLKGGGNWEDLTGNYDDVPLPEYGTDFDLKALTEEWAKQSADMFGDIDIFGDIKEQWNKLGDWWNTTIDPFFDGLSGKLGGWGAVLGSVLAIAVFGWVALIPIALLTMFGGLDFSEPLADLEAFFTGLWDGIYEILEPIITPIVDFVTDTISEMAPHFEGLGDTLSGFFDNIGKGLATIKPLIEPVIEAFGHIAHVVAILLGPAITLFLTVTKNLWEFLARMLQPAIEALGEVFRGVMEIITGVIGVFVNLINGDFGKAWDSFVQIFEGVGRILLGLGEFILELVWNALAQLGELIADLAVLIWDALTAAVGWILSGLWDIVTGITQFFFWDLPMSIINALAGAASWLVTAGADVLSGFWNGLVGFWNDTLWPFISGFAGSLMGGIGDLGGVLLDAGKSILQGLWDGLKWGWNKVAGWWNDTVGSWGFEVPSWVPFVGGESVSVPDMPIISGGKFHTGGIVPGMGEVNATVLAGEMVLTSSQQARLFAMANGSVQGDQQGGGKIINFYGDLSFPNITNPDDAGKFIDNLEMVAG